MFEGITTEYVKELAWNTTKAVANHCWESVKNNPEPAIIGAATGVVAGASLASLGCCLCKTGQCIKNASIKGACFTFAVVTVACVAGAYLWPSEELAME